MKTSQSGVERLLAALTDQPIPLTCEECEKQFPALVDVLASGGKLTGEMRTVMAHIDRCPKCEALLGELLDDLMFALDEAEPIPARSPDPSSILFPALSPVDIWRTNLDAAWNVIKNAAGQLGSIKINFKMPDILPPLPAPGILAEEGQSEKLVFSRSLTADYGVQIELRARRAPDATECNLLLEVDSPQPDVPLPNQVVLKSGQFTWTRSFDQVGQAMIERFPVVLLANLEISLQFRD